MSIGPDLTTRSDVLELMDDYSIGGQELVEALEQLRQINLFLGAALPTLEGVWRLWQQAGYPSHLSILDIGAGSGDLNRLLLYWAMLFRIHLRITLIDNHPETCEAAAAYYQDEPRVRVEHGDLFELVPRSADIVTASLFIHHFSADQLPDVLRTMAQTARLGVVVNDLHRHPLAWAGIWLITRLFFSNRMIRNDAPLSVRRGFRATDFEHLRTMPGLEGLRYMWRPLFRYLIILPASEQ